MVNAHIQRGLDESKENNAQFEKKKITNYCRLLTSCVIF